MTIVSQVEAMLSDYNYDHDNMIEGALADAERLANLFAEVRPQPYIVPIERFVGMTSFRDMKPVTR